MDLSRKTIGFLGCGKISSAVCRGYAGLAVPPLQILISRRNHVKSSQLHDEFPNLITVVDNDVLVATADILFIGLIADVAREELPKLVFRCTNQLVISMMATVSIAELRQITPIDHANLVRSVPLPSAARRTGPILIHPPHQEIEAIFNLVGTPVPCEEESSMRPLVAITGQISPFYELQRISEEWAVRNGVTHAAARSFIAAFHYSLAQASLLSHDSFEELCVEAATPGGLNEQSVATLRNSTHYQQIDESLCQTLKRL